MGAEDSRRREEQSSFAAEAGASSSSGRFLNRDLVMVKGEEGGERMGERA